MPKFRKTFTPIKVSQGDRKVVYKLSQHGFYDMTLDEPAISLMTDFRLLHAKRISMHASIEEALQKMHEMNMRMLVAIDPADGHVVGLTTASYLQSEELFITLQRKGLKRKDAHVSDVMMDKERMNFVRYDDVCKARIGDILETLSELQMQYAFVTHDEAGEHCIRGLFSAREISLQLEIDIDPNVTTPPRTFAQLIGAIHKSRTGG